MQSKKDLIEPLVDDILSDVADSFFTARRSLEAQIDLFHESVKELHGMAADIHQRAALLNLLLVEDRQAKAFYRMLGLEAETFLAAADVDPRSILPDMPSGFGFNNRYTKLVFDVYSRLKEGCDIYMNGQADASKTYTAPEGEKIYYRLIVKMHQLLNDEIIRINETISPSCTLQFAKAFKPDVLAKEKVTGGGMTSAMYLDDKLCYRPIDLSALGLMEFPLFPKIDDVKAPVKRFCKDLCRRYPKELKHIVEFIKQRISAD
jgi:hypothetical protein